MTSENPFAAPKVWGGQPEFLLPREFSVVDGRRILCGRRVRLPPVCVLTGRTENLVSQHESLSFPWYRLVVSQRLVDCHYFVHRSVFARRVWWRRIAAAVRITGWTLLLGPPFLVCGGLASGLLALVPIAGLLLLVGRAIVALSGGRLRVDAVIDRQRTLISGFSAEFFNSMAAL